MRIALTLVLMFFCASFSHAGGPKKALKNIKKGKYTIAKKLLDQSIIKDSTQSAAYYVYALYYYIDSTQHRDIDASYQHLLQSIENFDHSKAKKSQKALKKVGASLDSLTQFKSVLEQVAYDRAVNDGELRDFEYYLDTYFDAEQVPMAIAKRDSLAFEKAKKIGTVQAFDDFMENYPHARQSKDAIYKHDLLLLQNNTKGKKLNEYQRFVKKHPNNKALNIAIQKIYQLTTIDNTIAAYQSFLKKHPNTELKNQVLSRLKNLYNDEGKLPQYAKQYEPNLPVAVSPIIPVIDNGKYAYYQEGIVTSQLDTIPKSYLCKPINTLNLIYLEGKKMGIMDKNKKHIHNSNLDHIEYFGGGDYKATQGGRHGLIHDGGFVSISFEYEDIVSIEHLLMVKKGGKWGLRTIHDQEISPVLYDTIYMDGKEILVFQQDGKYAHHSLKKAIKNLHNGRSTHPDCNYDGISWLGEFYLEVQKDNKFGVITKHGQSIMPITFDQIIRQGKSWIIQNNQKWMVYRGTGTPLLTDSLDLLQYNDKYFAAKTTIGKKSKWQLYTWQGEKVHEAHDSIAIQQKLVILFDKKQQILLFPNGEKLTFPKKHQIKYLPSKRNDLFFVVYTYAKDKKRLYNAKGEQFVKQTCKNFHILKEDFVSAQIGDKFVLYGPNGEDFLNKKYDGIGDFSNGWIPLLLDQKFGAYEPYKNIQIAPLYDRVPIPFAKKSDYLIVEKDEKKGVINTAGELVLHNQYEEVYFWRDDRALVKTDTIWGVVNLTDRTMTNVFDHMKKTDAQEALHDAKEEVLIQFEKDGKIGVMSSKRGIIIHPLYGYIVIKGEGKSAYYHCEYTLPSDEKEEIEITEVACYTLEGKRLFTTKYTEEEMDRLECDE